MSTLLSRLEQYTMRHPDEVWVVHALVPEEDEDRADGPDLAEIEDEVLVFRGFSSSLVRPTAADPAVPVLPDTATIQTLDRLRGPYHPDQPQYIVQGLTPSQVEAWLDHLADV